MGRVRYRSRDRSNRAPSRRRVLRPSCFSRRTLHMLALGTAALFLLFVMALNSESGTLATVRMLFFERESSSSAFAEVLPSLVRSTTLRSNGSTKGVAANASRLLRRREMRNATHRRAKRKKPPTSLVIGAAPALSTLADKARLRVVVESLRLAGYRGAIVLGLQPRDIDSSLATFLHHRDIDVLPYRASVSDLEAKYAWLISVLERTPPELRRVLVLNDLFDVFFQSDPFASSSSCEWGGNDAVTLFRSSRRFGDSNALTTSLAALQKLLPHPDSCREGHFALVDEAAWSVRRVVTPLVLGFHTPVLRYLKSVTRTIIEHRCSTNVVLSSTLMEEAFVNLVVQQHSRKALRVIRHGAGCVLTTRYMHDLDAEHSMLRDSEGFVLRSESLARAVVVTGNQAWAPLLDDWLHHTLLNVTARAELDTMREKKVLAWLNDGRVLKVGDKLRKLSMRSRRGSVVRWTYDNERRCYFPALHRAAAIGLLIDDPLSQKNVAVAAAWNALCADAIDNHHRKWKRQPKIFTVAGETADHCAVATIAAGRVAVPNAWFPIIITVVPPITTTVDVSIDAPIEADCIANIYRGRGSCSLWITTEALGNATTQLRLAGGGVCPAARRVALHKARGKKPHYIHRSDVKHGLFDNASVHGDSIASDTRGGNRGGCLSRGASSLNNAANVVKQAGRQHGEEYHRRDSLYICGGSCCASRGSYFSCFAEVDRKECVAAKSERIGRNQITWGPNAVVAVDADIEVRDTSLVLLPGTTVVLAPGADIVAHKGADLRVLGTAERPCVLTAGDRHRAWGRIDVRPGGRAIIVHALLLRGTSIVVQKAGLSFIGGGVLTFRPDPMRCGPREGKQTSSSKAPVATHRSFVVQLDDSTFSMHSTLLSAERKCAGLISVRQPYLFDVHESHIIFVEQSYYQRGGAYMPVPAIIMSGEKQRDVKVHTRKSKTAAAILESGVEADAPWNATGAHVVEKKRVSKHTKEARAQKETVRPSHRRRKMWTLLQSFANSASAPNSFFSIQRTSIIDNSNNQHQQAAIVTSGIHHFEVNQSFVAGWSAPPMRTFAKTKVGGALVAEIIIPSEVDEPNTLGLCRAPALCHKSGALRRAKAGSGMSRVMTWRSIRQSDCSAIAKKYKGGLVVSRHWFDDSTDAALHRLEMWRHLRLPSIARLTCITPAGNNFYLIYSRITRPFVSFPTMMESMLPAPLSKKLAVRAMQTFVHVAAALAFLHHSPLGTLLHADLRPAHILVRTAVGGGPVQLTGLANLVLLGGSGASNAVPAEWIPGCCQRADAGTLPREASTHSPECDMCRPVGTPSDVYQLGLRFAEFAASVSDPTFNLPLDLSLASHFEEGDWTGRTQSIMFALPASIDKTFPGLRSVLASCLDIVPAQRPSAMHLVQLLRYGLKEMRAGGGGAAVKTKQNNATKG